MYQSAASARPNWVGPETKPPGRNMVSSIERDAKAKPSPSLAQALPVPGNNSSIIAFTCSAEGSSSWIVEASSLIGGTVVVRVGSSKRVRTDDALTSECAILAAWS